MLFTHRIIRLEIITSPSIADTDVIFTENETNALRLWSAPNPTPFVKDRFREYVIAGRCDAVNADPPAPNVHPITNSYFRPEKPANCGFG